MIVGVDFSLTGTGLCAVSDTGIECVTVRSSPGDVWWSHPARVRGLADRVAEWVGEPPAWVIESPSFGSKFAGHDMVLSGWWLFVDRLLEQHGWEPPLRATPTQVKRFAVGKGGGPGTGKPEVTAAMRARHPRVLIRNNDEADAVVLAMIAAGAYKTPIPGGLTAEQQEIADDVRAGFTTKKRRKTK